MTKQIVLLEECQEKIWKFLDLMYGFHKVLKSKWFFQKIWKAAKKKI
jgi:hypothetical protein